jgi:antitoxin VapB
MSATAKVFMNGRSQAIRLPKDFRVSGKEVVLRRVAEGILIVERDPWEVCKEACAQVSDSVFDAMASRSKSLELESRAWGVDE